MTQGLLLSGVLCLLTFVLQSSRVPAVCKLARGSRLRSSYWRSIEELDVLSEEAGRLFLIGLQGALFFGNFSQLSAAISEAIAASREAAGEEEGEGAAAGRLRSIFRRARAPTPPDRPRMRDTAERPAGPRLIYLVIDMSAVSCLDSCAAKALEKTCAEVRELGAAHVVLVLPSPAAGRCAPEEDPAYARLFSSARACARAGASASGGGGSLLPQPQRAQRHGPRRRGAERPLLHIARSVDSAVAWCEDHILSTRAAPPSPSSPLSAAAAEVRHAAAGVSGPLSTARSLGTILQAVARGSDAAPSAAESSRLQEALLSWFEERSVPAGTVLWREGDRSERAVVLAEGSLQAFDEAGGAQLAEVGGCMLGEFGLITGERRQNTVTALSACRLHELTRARWVQMQEEAPRQAFVLASVALKYAGNRLRQVAFSALNGSSAVPV